MLKNHVRNQLPINRFFRFTNSIVQIGKGTHIPNLVEIGLFVQKLSRLRTHIYIYIYIYINKNFNDYYFWLPGTSKQTSILVPALTRVMRPIVKAHFFNENSLKPSLCSFFVCFLYGVVHFLNTLKNCENWKIVFF